MFFMEIIMSVNILPFMIFMFSLGIVESNADDGTSKANQEKEEFSEYDLECLIIDNLQESPAQAFKYAKLADEMYKSSYAQRSLAELYENGRGVNKDSKLALEYYKKHVGADKYTTIFNCLDDYLKQNQDIDKVFNLINYTLDADDIQGGSLLFRVLQYILQEISYELLSEQFYNCLIKLSKVDFNMER